MTGGERGPGATRESGHGPDRVALATIRTTHADPGAVAAALVPDDTDEMDTAVEPTGDAGAGDRTDDGTTGGSPGSRRVRTTIERGSAAGLRSTADDYLVNLDVADRTFRHATEHTNAP